MASLTVGITYFNEGPLLKECLDSLLVQQNPPEEILIYDDSSSVPLTPYVPADSRVRVIRGKENLGPSHGRNQILAETKSDFLHFHDADDWFDKNWIARVRSQLIDGVDAVFTEVTSHRDGKVFVEGVVGFSELKQSDDLVRFAITRTVLVPCGTYRTSLLRSLGGYRVSMWQSEDFDFHVRLAARHPSYRLILDPLVHIRIRKESRSQNFGETRVYLLKGLEMLSKELPQQYRKDFAAVAAKVGGQLFQLGMKKQAQAAFTLASELGGGTFSERPLPYRMIAKIFGAMAAERFSSVYRKILPPSLRSFVKR